MDGTPHPPSNKPSHTAALLSGEGMSAGAYDNPGSSGQPEGPGAEQLSSLSPSHSKESLSLMSVCPRRRRMQVTCTSSQ